MVMEKISDEWYKISIAAKAHCWVMEQDQSLWHWPKEYNGTDLVNVRPELLMLLKLKYKEIPVRGW